MPPQGFWNIDGWPRAEEWSAWWAFLAFAVTAVAATVALLQFGSYIREREERARPYLHADFEFRSVLLYIAVTNTSSTPATNVRLRVSPNIQSTESGRGVVFAKLFAPGHKIAQLGPGRTIRWFLDRAPDYFADSTVPRTYTVTLTYNDPRAGAVRSWLFWKPSLEPEYNESFILDIDQWGEASGEQDYDNQNWNINKRNEQVIKKLGSNIDSIRRYLEPPLPQKLSPVRPRVRGTLGRRARAKR